MVGLKMNVSANDLKGVMEILPSITAPTVSNLFQSDWFAVETIISEKVVREIDSATAEEGRGGDYRVSPQQGDLEPEEWNNGTMEYWNNGYNCKVIFLNNKRCCV